MFVLPGLEWIVSGGFWRAFIVCLVICPGIPQLLGLVLHSYWAPWHPRYQFGAYMPANAILALFHGAMAGTLKDGFSTPPAWVHWLLLAVFACACVVLTKKDFGAYDPGQVWSANKLYHNFLYAWYSYFTVVCYWGLVTSGDVSPWRKLVVSLPGVAWLSFFLVFDNLVSDETKALRYKFAHAHRYDPLWRRKPDGRYRLLRRAPDDAKVPYV